MRTKAFVSLNADGINPEFCCIWFSLNMNVRGLIAVGESGRDGKVYSYGKISNSLHVVDRLIVRLRKQYGKDVFLSFCYESGPCGFVLFRRLLQLGHDCIVVAPSKIARKPGDKIKTDMCDAEKLTKDHRTLS